MSMLEELHKAHRARLERFAARAIEQAKPQTPVKEEVAMDRIVPPTKEEQIQEWVERQKELANELFAIAGLPTEATIERIQREVCRHYGISRTDMISARRTKHLVRPRMVAVYLCRKLTTKSFPEIGRRFGGRDHTTILHAVRKVSLILGDDVQMQASIEMLTEKLGGEMS